MLDIAELPLYLSKVDQQLSDCFSAVQSAIKLPALRLIASGGKRLRPSLVIAACASQGAIIDQDVIAAAVSIELVHLGSIVHDDVIDNSLSRGGVPTVYAKEGTDAAIIVGDYMLAAAANKAASINGKIGTVVASAIMEMCDGQMQETVDAYNPDRSLDDYRRSIDKKTAALIRAACQVGGMCAEAPQSDINSLGQYGRAFGTAFQLIDDLLDFLATAKTMGKPVHNDIKEGVYTLPLLVSLKGSSSALVRSWIGRKPKQKASSSVVVSRLLKDGSFEYTLKEIRKFNDLAVKEIKSLPKNSVTKGLSQFPELYLKGALRKQTLLKYSF